MKKATILSISLLLSAVLCGAQESEKSYAPKVGTWSMGISIDPVASYIGNLFNNSTSNFLGDLNGEGLLNNVASLSVKKQVNESVSFCMNVGFDLHSEKDSYYVLDDAQALAGNSEAKVIDTHTASVRGASIALGIEKRFGTKRLQPILGVGALAAADTRTDTYSYGNAITELNQRPTSAFPTSAVSSISYARLLNNRPSVGQYVTFGAYSVVGAEFFLTEQLSITANVNVSALVEVAPQIYNIFEGYDTVSSSVMEYTNLSSPSTVTYRLSTNSLGANLMMNIYF